MNELKTNIIFLEVDQAIYTKVLDAMFKQEEEGLEIFKRIIPRMGWGWGGGGGFHIVICMLRTIYTVFNRSGITVVLSGAGLGGKGTVNYIKNV